jgi:membrane fusion protein, multidrug efflux system
MSDTQHTMDERVPRPQGNGAGRTDKGAPAAPFREVTVPESERGEPLTRPVPPAEGEEHPPEGKEGREANPRRPWARPLIIGAVLLAILVGVIWGLRYWSWSQTHVSTDDAFVTGNLVNVGPVISGTLLLMTVQEGDHVRRGQLLARLEDSGPRAALRQAQANYQAALSQIPQAERNLRYQARTTQAAIRRAQAAQAAQGAQTHAARQQVGVTAGTVRSQVRQAESQVCAAQAQAEQARAQVDSLIALREYYRQGVRTAQAALASAEQQVITTQKTAEAAASRAGAAAAEAERAARDDQRYRYLQEQGAVAAQAYDTARAQARSARAQLEAAQDEAEQAAAQAVQVRRSCQGRRSSPSRKATTCG